MNPVSERGRTFALDMGSDGAASLQKAILMKLSEFMGDYTDEVLAQYILVLVAHGKQQAQAVKDLEAFLGDRSEAFVAWLWDYLCSNLHLHTSVSKASFSMSGGLTEPMVKERGKGIVKGTNTDVQVSSLTHQHGKLTRPKKDPSKDAELNARNLPDLNGPPLSRENTQHRSGDLESDKLAASERNGGRHSRRSAKRSRSPLDSLTHKEKKTSDVKHHHKRHLSPPRVNATRRLLQSAVREAVAPAAGHTKSGSKRLRSVVSAEIANHSFNPRKYNVTENSDTLADASGQQAHKDVVKIDDVRQAVAAMPVDVKAVTAAPEDATKTRGSIVGSVWNRLGKAAEDKEGRLFELGRDSHAMREVEDSRFVGANTLADDEKAQKRIGSGSRDRLTAAAFTRTNEYTEGQFTAGGNANGFRGVRHHADERNNARTLNHKEGQQLRVKDRSEKGQEESVSVQYRLAKNMDHDVKEAQKVPVSSACNPSQKVMNISVNVNTWKSQSYENVNDKLTVDQHVIASQGRALRASDSESLHTQAVTQHGDEKDSRKHVLEMKKRIHQVQLEMVKLRARQSGEANKDVQKASSSTILGTEQVQNTQDGSHRQTVFVTNIHFAATKESLMAHFAQCGDIERVIMLTDGATGQPKGSAYVEFSTHDAVDNALALNETSFYSRVLKVVQKDAGAIQDTSSPVHPTLIRHPNPLPLRAPTRGRFLRGSAYSLPRFPSMRRPYGNPTNMQWRREAMAAGGSTNPSLVNGNKPGYGLSSVHTTGRSFTYVRSSSVLTTNEGTTEKHEVRPRQDEAKADAANTGAET